MNTMLTLMSLIGNLSYVGLLVAGLLNARKRDDLLKQERAFRLYVAALAVVLVVLGANVTREEWASVTLAAVNAIMIATGGYFTALRCNQLEGVGRE